LDGSIKNVLTAKVGDLKISCVLCASLQPGEQLSFEIEASLSANLNGLSSLFTSTEIGIQASTCIGPGSPLRVVFDTLGFPACKANLWAKYKPFIGEFDVGGSIPAFHGMFLQAEFGMPVHDPVGAVTIYCQGQGLLQTSAADKLQIANGYGGSWVHIGGKLKYVSVGGNAGQYVWGVNSNDDIFFRSGRGGTWQGVGGKLKQVEVGDDGWVWGVNVHNQIWTRNGLGGPWQHVAGVLKHVSVGLAIWGVNSADSIFVATNPNSVAGGAVPYTGSRNVGNWQTCYNNFKAAAGNLEFGAGVTVPLLWGGDFWIAKISGPHASGSKWKVEVFQIPFDQIAAAVKEVWDNTIVPAFEDAGDAIGSAASDVGDWTSGAAEDVGAWTSGAAEDVGQALCFWC